MSQTRWKEPVLAENLSVSQDKPNHSAKPTFVRFKTFPSHETEQPKKESPKKLFLEAVVIPKRPPFSPKNLPSRRREPETESESEQQGKEYPNKRKIGSSIIGYVDEVLFVTKTGPPARIRKPDVFHVKKAEQLEAILEANVATFDIASDEEVDEASSSIVANYDILKSQLESKEPVKDESHMKAPTIAYPYSQREDRFVDGLESALGPGSFSRILKKLPKVGTLYTLLLSTLVIYSCSGVIRV
jgi:hypothetical protein